MNSAFGRHSNIAIESPNQRVADLARAPMWPLGFELDNQGLDLSRQLVGIAYRAFGAVTQRLKPVFLIAIKDLVAGLPRNAELPAYSVIVSPSNSRATNRRRSSITELAF